MKALLRKAPPTSLIKVLQEKKSLALFVPIKRAHRQPQKHFKQINIAAPSDFGFLINEFDTFINKIADIKPT